MEENILKTKVQIVGLEHIKKLENALRGLKGKGISKNILEVSAALQYLSEVTKQMPKTVNIKDPNLTSYQQIIKFVEKWRIGLETIFKIEKKLAQQKSQLVRQETSEGKVFAKERKAFDKGKTVTGEPLPAGATMPEKFVFSKASELAGVNESLAKHKELANSARGLLSVYDGIDKSVKQGWLPGFREVNELSVKHYNKVKTSQNESLAKETATHRVWLEQANEKLKKQYAFYKTKKTLTEEEEKWQAEAQIRLPKIQEHLDKSAEGYYPQRTGAAEQHLQKLGVSSEKAKGEEIIRQKEIQKRYEKEVSELKRQQAELDKLAVQEAKMEGAEIKELATVTYPSIISLAGRQREIIKEILEVNQKINLQSKSDTFDNSENIAASLKEREGLKRDLVKTVEAQKLRQKIDAEQKATDKETLLRNNIINRVKLQAYNKEEKFIKKSAEALIRKNAINKDIYNSIGNNEERMKFLLKTTTNLADKGVMEIHNNLKKVDSQINKTSKSGMKRFSQQIKDSVKEFFSMEKLIQRISFVLTAKMSYELFDRVNRSIRAAIKNNIEFEDSFAKIIGIAVETDRQLVKAMRPEVIRLMGKYGENTADTTKALYDILSAQIEVTKATYVLEEAMKGAVAGFSDVKTVADLLTTTLQAYNLSAEKAADTSDLLFSIVRYGKTTMAELAPVFGRVAATSGMMKIPLEEIGASLATMTKQGIKTNVAITSLNQLLLKVAKPTDATREIMRKYNVELSITNIRKEGLAGIMGKLQKLTEEEMITLAGSRRSFMAMAAIVNDTEDYYANYMAMINRTGVAEDAFNEQSKTLAFQIKQLGGQVFGFTMLLGDLVFGIGKPLIGWLTNMFKSLVTYEETVRAVVKATLLWILATKILNKEFMTTMYIKSLYLIDSIKKLTLHIKTLVTSLFTAKAAGTSLAAVLGKMLPILFAIGAAFYVFKVFSKEKKYEDTMKNLNSELEKFSAILEGIKQDIKIEELFQGMVKEYERLASKTERTTYETERLNTIMEQLSDKTGIAAGEFDNLAESGNLAKKMVTDSKDEIIKLNQELEKNIRLQKKVQLTTMSYELANMSKQVKIKSFLSENALKEIAKKLEIESVKLSYESLSPTRSGFSEKLASQFIQKRFKEIISETSKLYDEMLNTTDKKQKEELQQQIKHNEDMILETTTALTTAYKTKGDNYAPIEPINKLAELMIARQNAFKKETIDEIIGFEDDLEHAVAMAKGRYDELVKSYKKGLSTIQDVEKAGKVWVETLDAVANRTDRATGDSEYYTDRLAVMNAEIERTNTLYDLENKLIGDVQKEYQALSKMGDLSIDITDTEKFGEFQSSFENMINRLSPAVKKELGDINIAEILAGSPEEFDILFTRLSKSLSEHRKRELAELIALQHKLNDLLFDPIEKYIALRKQQMDLDKKAETLKLNVGLIDLDMTNDAISKTPYKVLQRMLKNPDITQDAKFVIDTEINLRNENWDQFKDDLEYFNKSVDDIINKTSEWGSILNDVVFGDDLLLKTKTMTDLLKNQLVEGIETGLISWEKFGKTKEEVIAHIKESYISELGEMFQENEAMSEAYLEYKKLADNAELEQRKQNISATVDATKQMLQSLSQLWDLYYQKKMEKLQEDNDKRIEEVEATANREFRSELWLQREKDKIQTETDKKEKELQKKQQVWAQSQNAINTALSITKAFATLTAPFSFIVAAMYASIGAIQAKIIAEQSFAEGGMPQGIIRGAGTKTSDSIPIRVSDGEFISRADSVKGNEGIYYKLNNDLARGKTFAQVAAEYLTNNSKITSFVPKYAKTRFAEGGKVYRTQSKENVSQYDFKRLEDVMHKIVDTISNEPIIVNVKTNGIKDEEIARKSIRGQAKIKAHGIS